MPYSSSLSDAEWEIVEPLLPQKKKTRPPVWTKREILDGILYQLKNGCNWSDLPKDLPPYSRAPRLIDLGLIDVSNEMASA
jgi:transposase